MKVVENKDTVNAAASVNAFWMSNEITNSEYREYVRYVKQHPEELMCWIDLAEVVKGNDIPKTKDGMQKHIKTVKYSEIVTDIIDDSKFPCDNYFTNKKYDNYPVVGVSQRHARFYCNWKTKMENDRLIKNSKPTIHDYRLPTEVEWTYVATQTQAKNAKKLPENVINPSKSNAPNSWGLYNLSGNVSEWTSSNSETKLDEANLGTTQQNLKIVRGGSWRTSPNSVERKAIDQNTKEDYIGFRIVTSALSKK